jgi:hypothetical protein
VREAVLVSIALDRVRLAERRSLLDDARAGLKRRFVGIDGVIDELCDAITVWYVMPEILRRPVIVNLWGMTGVGKTDLVRTLVEALDLFDRFVEIELSNADATTWHSSVASCLAQTGALDGRPTLILFDEIQRFNTIDADGKPLPSTKFSDFWELLSDGRLARRDRGDFERVIGDLAFSARDAERRRARGDTVTEEPVGVWQASSFISLFGLDMPIEAVAELLPAEVVPILRQALASKRVFAPIDCTKSLIIISGNLDEAFSMAGQAGEADVDADIFHAFTSKITVVDIKDALTRRFKPEQVARFGNVHLIYASLRRADFEEIIERQLVLVAAAATESFGIDVTLDHTLAELVYRNGVFPVQGVRPVLSTVGDIVETNLVKYLFDALTREQRSIHVRYDVAGRELVAVIGEHVVRTPFAGRVDRIRLDAGGDTVANVAVHEAGHAVAYSVLFGLAPLQLRAKVASSYVGGFTFPHQIHETEQSLLGKAKAMLAGGLAEEVVFGRERATVGRGADREQATIVIVDYVRKYGFDEEFQANYMLDLAYAMDKSATDIDIEKLMERLVADTRQLLTEHRRYLRVLATELAAAGELDAAQVAKIAATHGVEAAVRAEGYLVVHPYAADLARS